MAGKEGATTSRGVASWGVRTGAKSAWGIVTNCDRAASQMSHPEYDADGAIIRQIVYDQMLKATYTVIMTKDTLEPQAGMSIDVSGTKGVTKGMVKQSRITENNMQFKKAMVEVEAYMKCQAYTDYPLPKGVEAGNEIEISS